MYTSICTHIHTCRERKRSKQIKVSTGGVAIWPSSLASWGRCKLSSCRRPGCWLGGESDKSLKGRAEMFCGAVNRPLWVVWNMWEGSLKLRGLMAERAIHEECYRSDRTDGKAFSMPWLKRFSVENILGIGGRAGTGLCWDEIFKWMKKKRTEKTARNWKEVSNELGQAQEYKEAEWGLGSNLEYRMLPVGHGKGNEDWKMSVDLVWGL